MTRTKIEWAERVWNPVRGCSRVSEGCRNCYAERQAARFSGPGEPFHGFVADGKWTGRVELIPEKLAEPLSWRKPARVFANSMSDLFHETLADAAIDRVFAVMAVAHWHTFIVLTKRAERMRRYLTEHAAGGRNVWPLAQTIIMPYHHEDKQSGGWPLPNVWLGVSVEDQESADARIPLLLSTPAAKRFVSYEPALGAVDFTRLRDDEVGAKWNSLASGIDWLIVGGESGPGARPCDVGWIRSAVQQCKAAGVPVFVKQVQIFRCKLCGLCGETFDDIEIHGADAGCSNDDPYREIRRVLSHQPSEWPEDLRVRDWPEISRADV